MSQTTWDDKQADIHNHCALYWYDVKLLNLDYILTKFNNEWVHALGVSVEIELKMDWQGCKKFYIFLHLIG